MHQWLCEPNDWISVKSNKTYYQQIKKQNKQTFFQSTNWLKNIGLKFDPDAKKRRDLYTRRQTISLINIYYNINIAQFFQLFAMNA